MHCPSCYRTVAPQGARCPVCGYRWGTLAWVATTPRHPLPPALVPPPPAPVRGSYRGAPAYRGVPRWGFPPAPWRPPVVADRGGAIGPVEAARSLAGTVVPLLWATAVVALVAAGAELWRYVLLVQSRTSALSAPVVATSDALVAAAGTVAPFLALLSGAILILWCVRAGAAAAFRAHVTPARSTRAVVFGWLVPIVNLVRPGAILAEIEHAAAERPPGARPRPSRFLLGWWVAWALGEVLALVAVAWSFRSGIQALADGVVLHAAVDLVGAVVAGWTGLLVVRLTTMLGPFGPPHREVVVAVHPAVVSPAVSSAAASPATPSPAAH